MILIVIVMGCALLILLLGFLGIKIPFVSGVKNSDLKKKPSIKKPIEIDESLVKKSIDETIKRTRFLKKQLDEHPEE